MMRVISIIGLLLILLTGCGHYESVDESEYAELTLKVQSMSTGGRGNVTDYPAIPTKWSQAERVADGRYIYNLSVYIVNSNNKVVAVQENLSIDNQATEAVVTFDKSYGLKRGIYRLMVVANNSNHTIDNKTYKSGLIGGWDATDYDALMNNKIGGDNSDNVSPYDVIQPLSLMKEIELHAGNNTVYGELVRTFARIRIEVKNNSGALPLKINNLTFSDNFTQKEAYVFDDGTDRNYFKPTVAPISTSKYAIQPFTTENGENRKTVDVQTSAVVFDSYLLESKLDEGEYYTYILDLAYEGVTSTTVNYLPDWSSYIYQTSDVKVGEESFFLFYNSGRQRYLSAGDGKVVTATLSTNSTTVGTDNVWQVISTGKDNEYYIKNVETGLYMQAPNSNSVGLGILPVAYTFANRTSGRTTYLTLRSGNYINMNSSSSSYNVQGSSSNNSTGNYYRLYEVNKQTSNTSGDVITYNAPIKLTTIDPVTQQSSLAKTIKRNDFINVLVTVSYNPESGTFEFNVEDWKTGGGSVEFE